MDEDPLRRTQIVIPLTHALAASLISTGALSAHGFSKGLPLKRDNAAGAVHISAIAKKAAPSASTRLVSRVFSPVERPEALALG